MVEIETNSSLSMRPLKKVYFLFAKQLQSVLYQTSFKHRLTILTLKLFFLNCTQKNLTPIKLLQFARIYLALHN